MATRISVALEAETGTGLCRVKLEGGSLGGYRSEILTENLSERENAIFMCSRCKGIMKDASLNAKGEQLCVCCKRENENLTPHGEYVRTTILTLKCGCPLSKRGCEWLGRLESVANHLTTCGQVYESCQLSCGVVSTRDEMGRHVREECSQREEECLHCSGVHKVCEMVEHVKVCGKVSVLCELGCGIRVYRESILCHQESVCSEETVVCPYEKYRCEVVALKRRELKQHLEDNRTLHLELKLNAMEENFHDLSLENMHLKEQVSDLNVNIVSLHSEIKILQDFLEVSKVMLVIKNISEILKPNLSKKSNSLLYEIFGYPFTLGHSTDDQNFQIQFRPMLNSTATLWPFRAVFITRMISHRNVEDTLVIRSPIICIQESEYHHKKFFFDKQIGSFPLSTDLKDFIKSDSLELEITIRILKCN